MGALPELLTHGVKGGSVVGAKRGKVECEPFLGVGFECIRFCCKVGIRFVAGEGGGRRGEVKPKEGLVAFALAWGKGLSSQDIIAQSFSQGGFAPGRPFIQGSAKSRHL